MSVSETKRLRIVEKLSQYNYQDNKELKQLIILAAEVCEVPIVLITFMHKNTQVIKCKIGVDVQEISRKDTFCRYLKSDEVMVVPNALEDKRFENNPLVTGEMSIRFYAGAPLVTSSGAHIGSLCIADQKPQSLSESQKSILSILSKQVIHVMELQISIDLMRKKNLALKSSKEKIMSSENKLRAFFNSSKSCHLLIDKDYSILDFNKCAEFFVKTNNGKTIKVGQNILLYVNDSYTTKFAGYFELALAGVVTSREVILNNDDQLSSWDIAFQPIFNKNQEVSKVAFSATNIDERKNHIAEIINQNRSLVDIAYIQSHEYRRPVASILGLMNLIKSDDYKADKETLEKMGMAAEELDLKLRKVIDLIHDTSENDIL